MSAQADLEIANPPATAPVQVARLLAAQPDRWRPLTRFDERNRVHVRLDSGLGWEAWVLTWLPGQGTFIHDHGGSAGAFVVVEGALTEETYGLSVPRGHVPAIRHLDVGRVRAFSEHHVHRVTNTGDVPAVSVHAYAPAIASMTTYEVERGHLTAVGVERAGEDW